MTNQADNQSIKTIRIPISGKSEAGILAAETGVPGDAFAAAVEAVQGTSAIIFAVVAVPYEQYQITPGLSALREKVDSLILVQNGQLDQAVEGLADLLRIAASGSVNLDAADLKSVLRYPGPVHLGVGKAGGKDEYNKAIETAAHSDLTDTEIKNARSMIVGMTAAPGLDMAVVAAVMEKLQNFARPDANIVVALGYDERMADATLHLTVLACNYDPQG